MPSFRRRFRRSDPVAVIGLGRFGGAVAESLTSLGKEVLAIDEREDVVRRWADRLTHVVHADATDSAVIREQGLGEFGRVIVGIGTDIEASVLTVVGVEEAGARQVWAKANNPRHGRILHRVGAHHVIYPEAALGEQVAHLVTGKMMDFVEFDDGYAIVKTRPSAECLDKSLATSALRTRHGVTVVGIKRADGRVESAHPGTIVGSDDLLIVAGPTERVEKFAAVT